MRITFRNLIVGGDSLKMVKINKKTLIHTGTDLGGAYRGRGPRIWKKKRLGIFSTNIYIYIYIYI